MSNSVAPTHGAFPSPYEQFVFELRAKIWTCLHAIEDSIDRIDPPFHADDLQEMNLNYVRDQVGKMQRDCLDALVAIGCLVTVSELQARAPMPTSAEQQAILDELDDVILPCEGGDA